MLRSYRRLLPAGVLLLVLALAVTACASNAAAVPNRSTSTSAGSANATSAAVATEPAAATAAGAVRSPVATTSEATEVPTSQPVATTVASGSAVTNASGMTGTTGMTTTTTPGNSASGGTAVGGSSAETVGADGIANATYKGVEYSFQGPDQLAAGWTRLTLDNQGKAAHDLQLFKLDPGKTLQDVTQALAGNGPPDWAHQYGSVAAGPGKQASFITNLTPGNYVLLSFGDNQQGPPDAAQGMLKLVTVSGTAPAASAVQLPKPDVTVNMVDYHFEITGTFKSGSQTVFLKNSGTEMHEAQVLQLKPGTTFEQFQKLLMQSNPSQQQSQIPATPVWGMTLSPNTSAYSTVSLTPGDYAVVCFIPSAKNGGKPHYMLGMISSVTVK